MISNIYKNVYCPSIRNKAKRKMPLTSCKDCGNDISDKAVSCPHCGYKVPTKRKPRSASASKSGGSKILIAIGLIGFVCLAYWAASSINQSSTPRPRILNSRIDNARSTMLKNKESVHAVIRNEGGEGRISVSFVITQPEKEYKMDTIIIMKPGEVQKLDETFDQVRLLDGNVDFKVNAKAI